MTFGLGIRRLFGKWVKLLRLSIYFACVFSLLSVLAATALNAKVNDAARALGRQLADLPELTRGAEEILLNGARMYHARVTTRESVATVLDRFEEHCKKNPGPMAEAMRDFAAQQPKLFEKNVQGSFRHAVMRDDSEQDGALICFVDDRETGLAGMSELVARFAQTSDLSEFGEMRYVFAERRKDGKTLVVTMWNQGPLNVSKMFPATGDADGNDSRVLPRPPEARRTLVAAAEGMPFALRTYESGKNRADVQTFYDRWMTREGWQVAAKAEREATTAYFRKDGYQVFLTLAENEGRTYATLIEAGPTASSQIATVEISESP
jgi:hypothetical protein